MAQRSGLFDSTEIVQTIDGYPQGNRAETADFFAKYFSNFIGNGVFTEVSTSFQVITAGGMKVTVKKGSCFINGYMAFDDEDEVFTLTAGHTHWFVQRAHIISGGDITKTWIVDAAEGELPLRDGAYYDLLIAKVVIPSGATAITDGMITDYRYDKNLCGAVTSLKPSVVPTLPDDVLKYVSNGLFRTVGGVYVDVGNTKSEIGSYIGTGTPPTLTFSFPPKAVVITTSGVLTRASMSYDTPYNNLVSAGLETYSFQAIILPNNISLVTGGGTPKIFNEAQNGPYAVFMPAPFSYNMADITGNTLTWASRSTIGGIQLSNSGVSKGSINESAKPEQLNFYNGCQSGITYNYVALA